MATQPKVKGKAKAKPKGKAAKKGQGSGRPAGLNFTANQWKAYSAASSAFRRSAYKNIAIAKNARRYRSGLAVTAATQIQKYHQSHAQAAAASVAANASAQSWRQSQLAHQNTALRIRVERQSFRLANILGRAQFNEQGQKQYTNRAVMRTVTNAQALSHEKAIYAKLARQAKSRAKGAVKKSKKKKIKGTTSPITPAQKAQVGKQAMAAGIAAARATAPKAAKAKAKAPSRSKSVPTSAVKPKKAKGRTAQEPYAYMPVWAAPRLDAEPDAWFSNGQSGNCVAVAIANNLLYTTGYRMPQEVLDELTKVLGENPKISHAVDRVQRHHWPAFKLNAYSYLMEGHWRRVPGCIVGYEAETGPHAAMSLDRYRVVTWGTVVKRTALIEEAWMLDWSCRP